MNIKRKIPIRLLCVLIVLLIFLVSCGDNSIDSNDKINEGNSKTEPNAANETTPEQETTDILAHLPEMDFGGYEFRIISSAEEILNNPFPPEIEDGDTISEALFERNRRVEERFNISIKVFSDFTINDGFYGEKTIKAGEDAYDLIVNRGYQSFNYAANNLALDWRQDMPHVNLDALWWNQDAVKNFTVFGKLYVTAGDINYANLGRTQCMLFNKELFTTLGLEYPYKSVLDGTWTQDKFGEIARQGIADLNGDGEMTDEDQYGFHSLNIYTYPNAVFYSGGDRVITVGSDGVPELTVFNERTVNIYNKFFELYDAGAMFIGGMKAGEDSNVADYMFWNGRALLYSAQLVSLISHRAMDYEIGVVPLPKYEASQPKYYGNVGSWVTVHIVPVTVSDTEKISLIIEALAIEGMRVVTPAFYEKSLKTKHARDDESEAMIDIIKDGLLYDYGSFNGTVAGALQDIGATLLSANSRDFASLYEKNESRVQVAIDKLSE